MNKFLYLLLLACCGCSTDTAIEKHQTDRNRVVDIRDRVKEINTGDVMIGPISRLYLANECLIITDYQSFDRLIYLFDRKEYRYLTAIATRGQGPGELANMGHIGADEPNRLLYVLDHGKASLFCYPLDSVLVNPDYVPTSRMKLTESRFPSDFQILNDSICYGRITMPIGDYGFNQAVAKWNIHTAEIKEMNYTHPAIERKRVSAAMSEKLKLSVEVYHHHDLMTLGNLDGDLICNVYGPVWDTKRSNALTYYRDVVFYKDKILATYAFGRDNFGDEHWPTAFLVFDLSGNYLKTLETGCNITDFVCDEPNHRIVMNMDGDIQFGYFDLDGLVD